MPEAVPRREVHVHVTTLADAPCVEELEGVLCAGERERATRFARPGDRAAYVVAHALLRRSLSRHANLPPEGWRFEADRFGKPRLSGLHGTGPSFNLTHTDGLVACVIGPPDLALGIDAEAVDRPLSDLLAIARRFFSADEASALEAHAPSSRRVRFAELWTLKEAFVKAVGTGLSHPLDQVAFEWGDRGSLTVRSATVDAREWQFALFAPTPRHRLSIALKRPEGERFDVCISTGGDGARPCVPLGAWPR
jgi:4'-phosphopantetheinyl transferase